MFEFNDEDGFKRFFKMEDQLEIADNKTHRLVQFKLNSKIQDEEDIYKALQGQIDLNNAKVKEVKRSGKK